ncbi:MAG: hypothetical protein HC908_09555 [Calothrix sp. SM1_7_51]|nr:hypothetical protein [Calothrix sp. SM1_7_51]
MESIVKPHSEETIHIYSLADLDQLVSERFNLPLRPYSTDVMASLELVVYAMEKTKFPYFEISKPNSHAFPDLPYAVSFDKEQRTYGKTMPLAICHDALHRLRGIVVSIPGSYYWDMD